MASRARQPIRAGFFLSAILVALVAAAAWLLRRMLHDSITQHPALLPAAVVGMTVILLLAAASLIMERRLLQIAWIRRVQNWTGLQRVGRQTLPWIWIDQVGDPLEALIRPLLRFSVVKQLADQWIESEMGTKPSRYLLLIMALMLAGWWAGARIAGPLFGAALLVVLALATISFVMARVAAERARFTEQLPLALDALRAGLAAGLSFQQAVEYAKGELPDPVAVSFRRLHRRLELGWTLEAALSDMLEQNQDETLQLVVEGIRLQRQFGGDLIQMLEETAGLLRERVELEREVRAVTSQGRLSGWVIAGLVPVSAGILLATNPRYIDVLFDTLIGQMLLVVVLMLQLVGWVLISRLARIRY